MVEEHRGGYTCTENISNNVDEIINNLTVIEIQRRKAEIEMLIHVASAIIHRATRLPTRSKQTHRFRRGQIPSEVLAP